MIMTQLELHKKIDELLTKNPTEVKPEDASGLISVNEDARQYFFTKADERWLDWLWGNGFLGIIKQKAEDPTRYGYRTPEVNYLVRMAEKMSAKVVDIILVVPVSAETFNPEVVDRFLWICSILPADQLARVVQKIHDEKWIPLLGVFNQWGFEYEKMFQTLADAKDYESILLLAEVILAIRLKENIKSKFTPDRSFYFNDLGYTKVFNHLVEVDDIHKEKALALASRILREITIIDEKEKDEKVFEATETFHLYDVDFFELNLEEKEHLSARDDVRSLAAVVKTLVVILIGEGHNDIENVQRLYRQYFALSPESQSMWRLRLFVMSLCPKAFKDELKLAFFRIFGTERYHELISGTEYQKTLQAGFSVLSEQDKREYVSQILEYFTKRSQDAEDQKWHKTYGWRILSSICAQLTDMEKKKAHEAFGKALDLNYEPEPSITGGGFASTIIPQAPITPEKFQKMTIPQIAEKLCGEWAPKALAEKYKDTADFHRPIDADGVGTLMKSDMANRIAEYLAHAQLFFERESLDSHYTYAFLQGIYEVLRGKKLWNADISTLLAMLNAIAISGQKEVFDSSVRERESFGGWLGSWSAVHNAMSDVLKELLSEDNSLVVNFTENRGLLLELIAYLLKYSNPEPKDEQKQQTRANFRGELEYTGSDPFTAAINSVRGRAFEALALFIYQDGKQFPKDAKIKISEDVKQAYKELLKRENSRAVMFVLGHYLPSFYFRDKEWVRGLLPQIFSTDPGKKDLYLAAWEGYLANNLYQEMFLDPDIQKLYERGIVITPDEYTKRRYFKELDEGIATHLALAFMHYEEFGFKHDLFKQFWSTENLKRHKEFISFMGRYGVSRDSAVEWVKYNKVDVENLKRFWNWILEHSTDPNTLVAFGFWIKADNGIFELPWLAEHIRKTLEKTKGVVDWDYGLMRSIPSLAKSASSDTLKILRLFLLEAGVRSKTLRMPFSMDNEWFEAFRILYSNPDTKSDTYTLIDDLIREGGSIFWNLKGIFEDKTPES